MDSREAIVRLRRSEKTREIICRLSVSFEFTRDCLTCVSGSESGIQNRAAEGHFRNQDLAYACAAVFLKSLFGECGDHLGSHLVFRDDTRREHVCLFVRVPVPFA